MESFRFYVFLVFFGLANSTITATPSHYNIKLILQDVGFRLSRAPWEGATEVDRRNTDQIALLIGKVLRSVVYLLECSMELIPLVVNQGNVAG
jgi:hypothetical protein